MKKIRIIVFVVLLCFILISCDSLSDKVKVEFIVDGVSTKIKIEKDIVITKELVPGNDNSYECLFYLDEEMTDEYNDEPIQDDLKLYTIIRDDDFYENLSEEKAKELIVRDFDKKKRLTNDYPVWNYYKEYDDCYIYYYYGSYNGAYVVHFASSTYGWKVNETTKEIDGVLFNLPALYYPRVWNKGEFYFLDQAYDDGIINRDDLIVIADLVSTMRNKLEYESVLQKVREIN